MMETAPRPQNLSLLETKPEIKTETKLETKPESQLESPQPKSPRQFNRLLLIPMGLAIAAIGYGIWMILPKPAETILHLSGRLESDETDIGAKTGGRVVEILVREGDRVQKGQVVVTMADEEIVQQLSGLVAQVDAAKQEQEQAKYDVVVAENRIREADANLQQAQGDTLGRTDQAIANAAAAESDLRQAEAQLKQSESQRLQALAELKLAQTDRNRYAQLVAQGAVNQQQFDRAQTTFDTAQANLATAESTIVARGAAIKAASDRFAAARGNVVQVKTTGLNPEIRRAQLSAFNEQKSQAEAKLAAAQAKVRNAQASQQQIKERLQSFKVKSPIDGIVQSRPLEAGVVVASGKTLLTVLDPNAVYLRGYIPEGDLGKVRVGQTARVFLDSNPNQAFTAHVSQIDTKASFTPENIYFKQDRVKQVFGIKLAIAKPEGFAKSGMPADAEIDLNK